MSTQKTGMENLKQKNRAQTHIFQMVELLLRKTHLVFANYIIFGTIISEEVDSVLALVVYVNLQSDSF